MIKRKRRIDKKGRRKNLLGLMFSFSNVVYVSFKYLGQYSIIWLFIIVYPPCFCWAVGCLRQRLGSWWCCGVSAVLLLGRMESPNLHGDRRPKSRNRPICDRWESEKCKGKWNKWEDKSMCGMARSQNNMRSKCLWKAMKWKWVQWMNELMDKSINQSINERMNEWMNKWMNE